MTDKFDENPFDDWDKKFPLRRAQFQGREFVREADARWRDEYGAELRLDGNNQPIIIPPPVEAWKTNSLSRWEGRLIPNPEWFMDQWIPMGQLVGLYGRPGARKSTLILQWMIASVLGRGFGNCPRLTKTTAYGLFCEDSEFEIARRAKAMLTAYGASFADLKDCHAESLVNANLTTFVRFNRAGRMLTTPAWDKFLRDLDDIKPGFVGLDTVPDFFGGNEINRGQVHDFLRLLDATAIERSLAMVFSAHPSLRGIADRSLASGSTGWEGKARARLTLEDPTDNDDESQLNNQSDRRILTLFKANYAKNGEQMLLTFKDGRLVPDNQNTRSPVTDAADEATLLTKLKDALDAGTTVSNYRDNRAYAPTILADKAFPFLAAEAAFKRLFAKKILRFDPKKRGADRWIVNQPTTQEDQE